MKHRLLSHQLMVFFVGFALLLVMGTGMVIAQTNSNSNTNTSSGPTLSLTISKTALTAGQSATLTWSSSGASSCTAAGGWTGIKTLSGTQAVTPTVTTVYTLTCKNSLGTQTTKSVTISVTTAVNFLRGDANRDKVVDVKDIETIGKAIDQLRPTFVAGNKTLIASCQDAADANDDGKVDVNDATKLIDLLYGSKAALKAPYPAAGTDTTVDTLTCLTY